MVFSRPFSLTRVEKPVLVVQTNVFLPLDLRLELAQWLQERYLTFICDLKPLPHLREWVFLTTPCTNGFGVAVWPFSLKAIASVLRVSAPSAIGVGEGVLKDWPIFYLLKKIWAPQPCPPWGCTSASWPVAPFWVEPANPDGRVEPAGSLMAVGNQAFGVDAPD